MSDLLFRLALQHADRVTARHLGTEPTPSRTWGWPLMAVAAAGLGFAIALGWQEMRDAMAVGGSCGTGPYGVARPCPADTGTNFVVAFPLGFLCAGLLGLGGWAIGRGTAALACIAWPVLFLSFGWNFLDFGLNPAEPTDGPVTAWLVCAGVFAATGLAPLVSAPWVLRRAERHAGLALGVIVAGLAGGAAVVLAV